MAIDRRKLLAGGLGSAGVAAAGTPKASDNKQFINHWIIPHAGDCGGCVISKNADGSRLVCNECGEEVDMMVSSITYYRMAEALERAQLALNSAHNSIVHDGKPEHSYTLDFRKEMRFIEETLKQSRVDPRPMEPLK